MTFRSSMYSVGKQVRKRSAKGTSAAHEFGLRNVMFAFREKIYIYFQRTEATFKIINAFHKKIQI